MARQVRPKEESPEYLPNGIIREIERSQSILELQADWDDEGSPGYQADTLHRATDFVAQNALRLWHIHRIELDAPHISPGPGGSIDIHWETSERELLINIPKDINASANFYGDNKAGQIVKGVLDRSSTNNLWLLMWLMQ